MLRQPSGPTCTPHRRRRRGLTSAMGPPPASATSTRSGTPICGAASPTPRARRMVAVKSAINPRIASVTDGTGPLRVRSTSAPGPPRMTIGRARPRRRRRARGNAAEAAPGRACLAGLTPGALLEGPKAVPDRATGIAWVARGQNPLDLVERHVDRVIALGAVRQRGLRRLRLQRPGPVRGPHPQGILALSRGLPLQRPELPRVLTQGRLHGGLHPGLAAVGADLHLGNAATPGERPAAEREPRPVLGLHLERAVRLDDRLLAPALLLPVPGEIVVGRLDARQPLRLLHPVAVHDQHAHRRAVLLRDRG